MNRLLTATLTLLLVLSVVPAMGQRWVERHSTESDRDLDRVSFAGKITSIDGQVAMIRTDDGDVVRVHLGPRWYWHERGYRLRTGIHVEVSGWYDDEDESSCFAGYISGDGFHFELADSDGYPLWAQGNDRNNWRPRREFIVNYYWRPHHRTPIWWRAPQRHFWNNHWGDHHRPRYEHYRGPGWRGPGHNGPRHEGPRGGDGQRHRGGRRGD